MWVFLFQFLMIVIVPLIWMALKAIGIGFVTYTGMNFLMDNAINMFYQRIGEMPQAMVQIFGILDIDVAFNIIVSAFAIRAAMNGVGSTSGTYKRMIWH